MNVRRIWKKARRILFPVFLVGAVWFYFCLPETLFNDSLSLVVYDKNDHLLGARIAADGQWRFPLNQKYADEKFNTALI